MKAIFRMSILIVSACVWRPASSQTTVFPETSLNLNSPSALSGKITDAANGEPLVGANIFIHEVNSSAASDENGRYRVQNLPAGIFLVEISYTGFSTIIESVTVNGETQKDFEMSHQVIETKGVTVTGISGAAQIKKTPIPVIILKKEDFLKETSTNLIDALSRTPGVSQISSSPAISKPVIRGLGYNRLVVINDGVRQEGQQWGDEHGVELDEYGVSKAEILKGPASIMYGSDALAGVINFISVVPAPQNMLKGNLFMTYQTNNRLRGFHGNMEGNHNGLIWGLNGTYKAAADYRNKLDGYVFNSKFNEKDFSGYIGVNRAWGYSHLLLSHFDQRTGLPEGERDDATGRFLKLVDNAGNEETVIATDDDFKSIEPFFPRQRIRHLKIAADNSLNIGKQRLLVNVGYQRNQREEFGNVLDPSERELYFDLGTLSYSVQLQFPEINRWKTSIGAGGMIQGNRNWGEEELIPEYDLFDAGGFIYTRKTFDKLALSGGLRFDRRSLDSKEASEGTTIKFEEFRKTFANISASLGLSYEASGSTVLKFNIARGFRAPSIPELSSNGAHEGTFRYEYGEQDLRSEKSLQADAGFETNSEHVSVSASIFFNRVSDFIYYSKLSSVAGGDSIIHSGGDDYFAFHYLQNNARLFGGEINLDLHPHPLDWLHVENTFSYVRGLLSQPEDGSRNLPFIPAPRLISELRGDFLKKGKTVKNLFAKLELDHSFAQTHPFTGYNTETRTNAYSLLNAGVGGDFVSRGKTLFRVFFAANNITDLAYQNHLSRLKYAPGNLATGRTGVFNMGRNFSLKLTIPFDFTISN